MIRIHRNSILVKILIMMGYSLSVIKEILLTVEKFLQKIHISSLLSLNSKKNLNQQYVIIVFFSVFLFFIFLFSLLFFFFLFSSDILIEVKTSFWNTNKENSFDSMRHLKLINVSLFRDI